MTNSNYVQNVKIEVVRFQLYLLSYNTEEITSAVSLSRLHIDINT